MNEIPRCTKCNSDYGYKDNNTGFLYTQDVDMNWLMMIKKQIIYQKHMIQMVIYYLMEIQ